MVCQAPLGQGEPDESRRPPVKKYGACSGAGVKVVTFGNLGLLERLYCLKGG